MPQRSWSQAAHRTPDVPRPELSIWQPLESERIRWEGQVLIVGQESDLPALMVITGKRMALIAGGELALEFPLTWMRPEPKLLTENGIRIYISPDGDSQIAQPMLLRAKAGRGAAMEIAAVLTGKSFASRVSDSPMHVPTWNSNVGAAPSVALPALKDSPSSSPAAPKAAWPPAETAGVAANSGHKPSAEIVPWRTGAGFAKPQPVPTEMSRAARLLGTGNDGYTVTEDIRGLNPAPAASAIQRKHHVPMWLLNLAIVALLVTGFGYVATEKGWGQDNLRAFVPGNFAELVNLDKNDADDEVAEAPAADETDVTSGGDNTILAVEDTTEKPTAVPTQVVAISNDIRDSIGGASNLPVTASVSGTPESTTVTEETAVPTELATETTVPTEVVEETDAPTEEAVSTFAPTETATAVATVEPTATVTAEVDPTAPQAAVTPAPTIAPTQEAQTEQPASVAEGTTPNQQFQQDGLRFAIEAVEAGPNVPSLPEINDVGKTWVVVTLTGSNTSADSADFKMSDFTLIADGNPVPLDTGTGWVNSLLGNEPAYGNTHTATWAPGEQHRFTLTFLAPANASNLVLTAGNQQIALDASITNSVSLNDVSSDSAPAATVTGTVVEVIDGQTIVVDVEGELITVRYLGIEAPTGDACHAAEATEVNSKLVLGQNVTLERQSVDTTARGLWVRDVWVTDASGQQVLVGQALVSQGAAKANVSAPNNRYEDWLNTSQNTAEAGDAGIWGACGN